MKIADFFAAIGFQIDDKALDQVDKKLETVRGQTLKLTAAITAAVYAMDKFAEGSVRSVVALTNFNTQTGLAIDQLQKWQAAAQLSNMAADANSVASSIQSLQDNLTQIRLGQGNASPFQLLGIDIRGQDAFSVLEQVRNRIQGLSPALATNMVQQMGIDPNLLNVLRLSREEFDKLGNSLVRSKKTTDAILRIGNAINRLKLAASKFKDDILAKLEPVFMGLIKILERFGRGIDRIIGLFERFPMIGALAAGGLAALLIPMRALMVLISPLTLALASLFLILEDIAVYFQGGKSVIGMAIEKIKQPFLDLIKSISTFINDAIVVPVENAVLRIKDLIPDFSLFGDSSSKNNAANDFLSKLNNNLPSLPSLPGLRPLGSQVTNNSAPIINNNFVINGEQNIDVARDVVKTMQEQLNYGLTDLNNGAVY